MATYFVKNGESGASPTTDPGTSGTWTGAYATLGAAITAATADKDMIKVSDEHVEDLSSDTTYTIANNINIICVDHQNTATPSTQNYTNYYIGHKSSARSINLIATTPYSIFIHGLCFAVTGADAIRVESNGAHYELSSMKFYAGTAGLIFGSQDRETFVKATDCFHVVENTTNISINVSGKVELINWTVSLKGATLPSAYIVSTVPDPGGTDITINGGDLSALDTTIFGDATTAAANGTLINCKLHSTATILGTQTNKGRAGWDVSLYNCSSGDEHYHLAHYNEFGTTIVETGIYASDGAEYNTSGTKYSWKIVTSADCTYYTPYTSPWIHQHHEGTSAITPSLEGFRDGSTTVIQNDEVWGEFSYQGTSGFPLGIIVNDRMALLGSAANQTSSKTYADWQTGTSADSAFKLATTANITPQEIGNLSARVCVGEPSITVYVDPQIRT
jgi:hypothetical protein